MKKKKEEIVDVESSGVCEKNSGFRFTKYKSESDANLKLDEYKSIGVMDSNYSVFKCPDCSTFHIGKTKK